MKKDLTTFGLAMLTIVVASTCFWVGCANLQHAFFEASPPVAGETNGPPLVQPRAAVVDTVVATSALAGPQGAAVGALVVSLLGLAASLINRAALRAHLSDSVATGAAPTSPDPPKPG